MYKNTLIILRGLEWTNLYVSGNVTLNYKYASVRKKNFYE